MPAAVPALIAAGQAALAGTTIFGLSVALSATLIGIGTFALNTLGASLAPKPKKQDFGDLSSSRTQQVKQPVTERRAIYGEAKVSGPINYFGSTSDNKYLHIVITLATHQSNYLGTTWFNDDPIHPDDLDAGGNVTAGKYSGKARIKKHLGGPGQIVDPDLLAEITEITSNFVGNEITYIYVRLEKDDALYKSGLPNIQQWTQGALVYDTRTSTSYWNPNSALCLRDYMTNTKYGKSTPTAKFPTANVTASANSCEEMVSTLALAHTVISGGVSAAADTITLNTDLLKFQTGDRVQFTTEGTLPTGLSLATNYYVIVHQQIGTVKIKVASSYANALARTAVNITGAGTGLLTVTKNAEPRYTTNGTLGTSVTPRDNISNLLSAMAGDMLPVGGKWILKPGIWVAPTITIDEDDLCGPIEKQSKHSRRERFNAVQGLFVTPVNLGEPGDYPLVKDTTYLTEDGTSLVPVIAQMDLPFTSRAQMAQRVARVQLNRHRRQRTVQITTNMVGLQLQAGDTFQLTHANSNYNQKIFEVSDFNLVPRQFGNTIALTCDLVCSESDSAIYDFNENTQEIQPAPPQTTTNPNPDHVTPPGAPTIREIKYVTTDGSGVKVQAEVSFTASTDFFVRQYQVRYKLQSDSAYTYLPPSQATTQIIFDITPGIYDIQIQAISIFDAHSSYGDAGGTFTIVGLADLPLGVQNFSVVSMADDCSLSWDQTVDIDVKVSGWVRIRHTPDLVDYSWTDARDITPALPGISTQANVPLIAGVYMAKFVDSTGNESANPAIIIINDTSAVQMNALATLTEHTTFTGTKTHMVVDSGVLRLDGGGLFDATAGLFDSAGGLFDSGAGVGQVLAGQYNFHAKIDCGKVIRCYASTHLMVTIYNASDLFDFREGVFDDAAGLFDGADITGISLRFFVRITDDDPNATPTWSEWQPFVAGYFTARGYDFYLEVISEDSSLQCDISELSASVDVPDVTDSGTYALGAGALTTVSFNKTFVTGPHITPVINDAQAGDVAVIPVANITSSNFKIGVLNSGSYVVRNITWFARGY